MVFKLFKISLLLKSGTLFSEATGTSLAEAEIGDSTTGPGTCL